MSNESQPIEKPSKTALKRIATELQDLGAKLVKLTPKQLRAVVLAAELPADLLAAVQAAQNMPQREARHRQIKYIGSLMRDLDPNTQQLIRKYFATTGR